MIAYIAILRSLEQTHCARMCFCMSDKLFIARFWISTEVVYLSSGMAGAAWNCCRLGASYVYTMLHVTSCKATYIRKVYACLAVICHLHFWQNDRDLLRATAVTRGRTDTEISVSTESRLPPLQQGFEPATFQSWVRRSNHWAIPLLIISMNWTHTCDWMNCALILYWYV